MPVQTTLRPALIARFPQPIRDGLQTYGLHVRTLMLQEDQDDILPIVKPPLIVDLCGQSVSAAARILVALQTRQRRSALVPHLLVPHTAHQYQHLITGLPTLRAVILARGELAVLATWLWAPIDLTPAQVWVNLEPPAYTQPHLTPLIAALGDAPSVAVAAQRCAISKRTAYRVLCSTSGQGNKWRGPVGKGVIEKVTAIVDQATGCSAPNKLALSQDV